MSIYKIRLASTLKATIKQNLNDFTGFYTKKVTKKFKFFCIIYRCANQLIIPKLVDTNAQ